MADNKIGFVNAARVSAEAPQAEAARAKLEREFSPRDREIAEEQSDIRQLEERLSRDSAVMSEDEQRQLQREVVSRKRELRRVQEEFREDFNLRRNEELGRLQRRIVDTINQLARDNDFDLILSEGVIFASDKVDITEQVLERLQQDQ
ncbi:MAG: OmpH family outer membrane protein [Aquisalimonadaceae bacterium]